MNITDIKQMTDKELNSFLAKIQKNERRICAKCGDFVLNKRTIIVRKEQTTRTMCVLCENCYADLLEFLEINDAAWEGE